MKALVTGAAGFIGSHVVDLLLENGIEVTSFVMESDDPTWLKGKDTNLICGDCTDTQSLERVITTDLDYIFHLAAVMNASDAEIYDRVNYQGTKNVVDICLEKKVELKRFVYVSSFAASGPSGKDEIKDETSPCEPVTEYGRSKLKAEKYLAQFCEELPYTILRLGLVYGPRNRNGIFSLFQVISRKIRPILKNARTNVVYVKDVATSMLLAAQKDEAVCRTYCIGENQIYSFRDIADTISKAFGGRMLSIPVSIPLLFGAGLVLQFFGTITRTTPLLDLRRVSDMRHRYWMYDTSAVTRDLGYETGYELIEGVRETVEWYRKQGWVK